MKTWVLKTLRFLETDTTLLSAQEQEEIEIEIEIEIEASLDPADLLDLTDLEGALSDLDFEHVEPDLDYLVPVHLNPYLIPESGTLAAVLEGYEDDYNDLHIPYYNDLNDFNILPHFGLREEERSSLLINQEEDEEEEGVLNLDKLLLRKPRRSTPRRRNTIPTRPPAPAPAPAPAPTPTRPAPPTPPTPASTPASNPRKKITWEW
jgi:hypothetical protein